MEELRERIIAVVKNQPGIGARGIARLLNVKKQVINHVLYSNKELFYHDNNYGWHIMELEEGTFTDRIIEKFNVPNELAEISSESFNLISNWDDAHGHTQNQIPYITRTGRTIYCDSQSEVLMLNYLEENDLVRELGGQTKNIYYTGPNGALHSYYPDIFALLKDNTVAVIEVKALNAMSYHKNLEKYNSLEDYCNRNGYRYTMIDPQHDFMTCEEFEQMEFAPGLDEVLLERMNRNYLSSFNTEDVKHWYNELGEGFTKEEFRLMVHSFIICYDWHNLYQHNFNVYNRPVIYRNGLIEEIR